MVEITCVVDAGAELGEGTLWDPKAGAQLTLPVDEVLTGKSNGAVILVQQENGGLPGPILGAASFTR